MKIYVVGERTIKKEYFIRCLVKAPFESVHIQSLNPPKGTDDIVEYSLPGDVTVIDCGGLSTFFTKKLIRPLAQTIEALSKVSDRDIVIYLQSTVDPTLDRLISDPTLACLRVVEESGRRPKTYICIVTDSKVARSAFISKKLSMGVLRFWDEKTRGTIVRPICQPANVRVHPWRGTYSTLEDIMTAGSLTPNNSPFPGMIEAVEECSLALATSPLLSQRSSQI